MRVRWTLRAANDRRAQFARESSPVVRTNKNAPLSSKTKVRFLNDVCRSSQSELLGKMMTASPNDVVPRSLPANSGTLGKHRIIATNGSNIIFA